MRKHKRSKFSKQPLHSNDPVMIKKRRPKQSPLVEIDWGKAAVLFQRSPQQERQQGAYPSTRELLSFLAAAGAVGLVFAFPPALAGVAALVRLGQRDYSSWGMRRTLKRLEKQKYVTVTEGDDGRVTVRIRQDGMTRALTYQVDSMTLNKPRRWDKKWRVVAFDIPEKYKGLRDVFRMRLGQLGLYQLQESVYVSPYPCFDEVEFLRELYGVSFTVRYIVADRIEDDEFLRQRFQLG